MLAVSDRRGPIRGCFSTIILIPGLFVPNGCMATGGSALNWFAANLAGGSAEAARRWA